MEEIWKDIEGYEGLYQISSFGNIRSFYKHNFRKGDVLRTFNNGGYRRALLYKDGVSKKILVHRLVANAFIPKVEGKPLVNHIDGNRTNNRVDNLEWCTNQENIIHAVKMGTVSTENAVKKLMKPVKQFTKDGQYIRTYPSVAEAIRATGATNVYMVCHHLRHTSGGYGWEYE